jgi:hypothetical protein
MSNGGIGYLLTDSDYELIDSGTCVITGDYAGCIKVGSTYYWLEAEAPNWTLHSDAVDDNKISYMTTAVWDKVKENGTWTWVPRSAWWDSGRDTYRLTGVATGDVSLVPYP